MSSARPTLDVPTLQSRPCEAADLVRADPYPPDLRFAALFSHLGKEAQIARCGLWGACPRMNQSGACATPMPAPAATALAEQACPDNLLQLTKGLPQDSLTGRAKLGTSPKEDSA